MVLGEFFEVSPPNFAGTHGRLFIFHCSQDYAHLEPIHRDLQDKETEKENVQSYEES